MPLHYRGGQPAGRQTDRLAHTQPDRQAGRQAFRQADKLAGSTPTAIQKLAVTDTVSAIREKTTKKASRGQGALWEGRGDAEEQTSVQAVLSCPKRSTRQGRDSQKINKAH